MKKYFEYNFDENIKRKLLKYYENTNISQHNANRKIELKLNRVNEIICLSKKDRVLDIGCSKGFFLKKISSKISIGVGMDISKNIVQINNKENTKENLGFVCFDGKNIPLKEKFSKIFILDVLEHVFDPDNLIKSIHSRLKKNGSLIIEVPFTGWLSESIFGEYHQGHLRYYDPEYLVKYLEKKKFKVKKIKVYNSVPFSSFFLNYKFLYNTLNFLVKLVPSKIYPYFGEIIVVCEKNEK